MMKTSPRGIGKLKDYEGFRGVAYIPVPGDRWTIGYGFTEGVTEGMTMTRAQADARLITELLPYERAVNDGCTLAPNQNEFDAMLLLCWNIGIGGFLRSTVLKAHNRGDHQSAARAFGLWNKSGGVVYPGLTRRRAMESALYLEPIPDDVSDPIDGSQHRMPQTVDPESRMTASPINRSAVVAGVTTGAATITQILNAISDAGDASQRALSGHGLLLPVLGVVALLSIGYVVWNRWAQRRNGWA